MELFVFALFPLWLVLLSFVSPSSLENNSETIGVANKRRREANHLLIFMVNLR